METFSYHYNGKDYEFILSMKAKIAIEKVQKEQLSNPAIAKIAMHQGDFKAVTPDQLAEILPIIDTIGDVDPLEVGYVILSTHPNYRDEVTREFYDALVEDMDMKTGLEATTDFFERLHESVFTRLAAMQENQAARMEARANRKEMVLLR